MRYNFLKQVFFLVLQIHHLTKRERDRFRYVCRSIDVEEGDLDDESDLELNENDQLDLDLESRSRLGAL